MRKTVIAAALLALSFGPPPAKVVKCSMTVDGLLDVFMTGNQLRMVIPRVFVFDREGGLVGVSQGYTSNTTNEIRRAMVARARPNAPRLEAMAASLTTEDGKPLDSAALKGTVTVVELGAAWCQPCRALEPQLRRFTGITLLLVDADTQTRKDEFDAALKK